MLRLMPFLKLESVLAHDFPGLLDGFRKYVEKRAYTFAHEEDSAAVFIRFHSVLDAGLGQRRFKPQSLLQLLGDVDKVHLLILKKAGVAAHSSSMLSRSVIFIRV